MMRIWNPTDFKVGDAGRSNCPRWRGQDYVFESNTTKDVSDLCGKWLITQYGYYGLVSLPDRNIVTDPDEYDDVLKKMKVKGIQAIYMWAQRVTNQWREEAKKCVDARERPPTVNNFLKKAYKIHKRYHADVMLSDPATIEEHEIMREILGTVEHDSDKQIDQILAKEVQDKFNNRRQYDHEPIVINEAALEVEEKPVPVPAEPESEAGKTHVKVNKNKKKVKKASKPKAETAPSTMANMKTPIDLGNAAN